MSEQPIITKSELIADLRALGLTEGQTVMLHASVKRIGWVVGGPDIVLDAILDVLTPTGTLMMLVGWESDTYHMSEWSQEKQKAYMDECPAFDPASSRTCRRWSILTEYLRTRHCSARSNHPDGSFAAIGRLAQFITEDHPLQYGYGPGSPLAKLCELGGKVLLLGSPLECVTLLHHSEHMAQVPNKRVAHYKAPMMVNGQREWVEIEEFDTSKGIVDWPDDYFISIMEYYLAAGNGRTRKVGAADSFLLDADSLKTFGIAWMEKHFAD